MRSTSQPTRTTADPRRHHWPARALLAAAAVSVGLVAGTFLAFAVSVMPGLSTVDDETFVRTMNGFNAAIESNPAFMVSLVGAFVLTASAAFLHHRVGARAAARWLLAAFVLYVAAFAVTMIVNVPLNESLATAADAATARAEFEGTWNTGNVARTIAATLALACVAAGASTRPDTQSTVDE